VPYPPTPRKPVCDNWHGTVVIDPFRWLEDGEAQDVRQWETAQHRLTRTILDARPDRATWMSRWKATAERGGLGWPRVVGEWLYYERRTKDAAQPALYRRAAAGGPEALVIDPNRDDATGLLALDWYYPSPDGAYLAYGMSRAGDEWSTLKVRELGTGRDLSEAIPRTRYAAVAWWPDATRFLYTRFPLPGTVPAGEEHYGSALYAHTVGEPWEDDPLVYQPHDRRDFAVPALSDDGRYLVLTIEHGWAASTVWVQDLQTGTTRRLTREPTPAAVRLDGPRLYLLTTADAPRGRVLAAPLESPEDLREVVPMHAEWVLQDAIPWQGGLLLSYLEDAAARLSYWHPEAGFRSVPLPGLGTVSGLSAHPSGSRAVFRYDSLDHAPALLAWAGGSTPDIVATDDLPPIDATVERLWAVSRDGTRVPVFALVPTGPRRPRPTVITGYGGFNIAMTPAYNIDARVWVEAGGVFVVAILRGGGEYGEPWHRAGMLEHKQNVFDDFLAAAEAVIQAGLARRDQLGLFGRSNGGLLVGATVTQHPDLARAAVAGVPLMDMLRYQRSLIGDLWSREYGSADDPEQFRFLHAYSPYHHVDTAVSYPALLIFTARRDSRVDPMHARKMTARLQEAGGGPVLLRIDEEAGHGMGMPFHLQADLHADILTFLAWQLGL
jgi:prolyl oligopeptidase